MVRMTNIIVVAILAAALAHAQAPMITGGPVNAASYVIQGLPNANIAQGSMFVLFGNNIGPPEIANAFNFPLPTTLSGTSIQVTVGGTATKAIMLFAVSSQVAAILPSTTQIGSGTLTLAFNGQTSNAVPINVVPSTLGIFTRNQNGSGPGVLFNFNSQSDQPLNSLVEAAHPGQVLTLWGTGLGAVIGNEANGPLPGNLDVPVTVYVGTKAVTPTYKGRSGCCAGIDQVVFTVPDGVEGCYVSVNVIAGGVVSNSATIAVTSSGSVCSDPAGFSTSDLEKVQHGQPLSIGEITIFRLHATFSACEVSIQGSLDLGQGRFSNFITSQDVLASIGSSVGGLGLSSAGSCTVSPFNYSDFLSSILSSQSDPVHFGGLDAGPVLNINGPKGLKQLPKQNQGSAAQPSYRYHVKHNLIGGSIPGFLSAGPAYLDPGNYEVDNGSGGTQVGAFTADLTIPSSSPMCVNEDALSSIPRTKDITINWTGGTAGGFVALLGSSADPSTGAGAEFQCLTKAEAGSFVVPAWVLSALPPSGVDPVTKVPVGFLLFATALPQPARFKASGIDIGYFNWATLEVKNVVFQ